MRNEHLKSVTVYFQAEEFKDLSEEANDHGVSVSAYIRARLGLAVRGRGAPVGKKHQRRAGQASVPAGKTMGKRAMKS
jgi:hypothetical protein